MRGGWGGGGGGGAIEKVDEFTYLWKIVSKKGGTDKDNKARIAKARGAFAMLRPIWRSIALTSKTELRVCGLSVQAALRGTSCGFGGLVKSAIRSFGDQQGSDG